MEQLCTNKLLSNIIVLLRHLKIYKTKLSEMPILKLVSEITDIFVLKEEITEVCVGCRSTDHGQHLLDLIYFFFVWSGLRGVIVHVRNSFI